MAEAGPVKKFRNVKMFQHDTMRMLLHSGCLPLSEAAPATARDAPTPRQAAPKAQLSWKSAPWEAEAKNEQDAGQDRAIGEAWSPTFLERGHGKQRLENRPERRRDQIGNVRF